MNNGIMDLQGDRSANNEIMDLYFAGSKTRETFVVDESFEQDNFILQEIKIFDDISKQIFNDPLFTNAHYNWNVSPKILYWAASKTSYERTRAEIQAVQARTGISNRGAYLKKRLENMVHNVKVA